MDELSVRDHLAARSRVLAVLTCSVAVDAAFLAAWVAINWWLDVHVIERLRLDGLDAHVTRIVKWTCGGATLVAVLLYIVEDLITQAIGSIGRIKGVLGRARDRSK